jgi:hypothetical protein
MTDPPPLPGGYKVGEKVFFTGTNQTVSNGDKLVHGQQGELVGPATLERYTGKGVSVHFPGNKGTIDCSLTQVRPPPPLPAPACAPHTRRCPRPAHPRGSRCRAPALTA